MSTFHILKIDSLLESLTLCNSSTGFRFQLSNIENISAQKNDLILGYITSPIEEFRYVFEVESTSSEAIVLTKKWETSNGPHIDLGAIDELQPVEYLKDFMSIPESTFREITSQFFNLSFGPIQCNTPKPLSLPAQTIYYGCPGSGKSHEVNVIAEGEHKEKLIWYKKATDTDKRCPRVPTPPEKEQKNFTNNVFRTTFHPDYDYATFVGCYKPVKDNGALDYRFVPQVFTNAYVCALRHPDDPVYLIIEEINRGNCAQIFGDLFQLLDRKNGISEYPIKPDTELSRYLAGEDVPSEELSLPANLNIYATMNTSDQSLFPMDSAFKRRWEMVYKPIEYTNKKAAGFKIHMGDETYPWIGFLKMVNERILDATDSEDKQMGEFFIKGDDKGNISERDFKNKVMFYIWNDVCKDHYTARRPNGKFFMRLANPQEGEKEYFTFVDLFDSERNKDSRLLKEFIAHLEKKYLEDHTAALLDEETGHIDWVKHLSLQLPDDSGNE